MAPRGWRIYTLAPVAIASNVTDALERASWIRRMFEAAIRLREERGPDAVADLSLGNPCNEPPPAFFDVLEEEIVPLFYDRGADGLPRNWLERMKESIAELAPKFSMHRMMKEYTNDFYVPAHRDFRKLNDSEMARAIGDAGGNIIETYHRRTFTNLPLKSVEVDFVIQTRGAEHLREILEKLVADGYHAESIATPTR